MLLRRGRIGWALGTAHSCRVDRRAVQRFRGLLWRVSLRCRGCPAALVLRLWDRLTLAQPAPQGTRVSGLVAWSGSLHFTGPVRADASRGCLSGQQRQLV